MNDDEVTQPDNRHPIEELIDEVQAMRRESAARHDELMAAVRTVANEQARQSVEQDRVARRIAALEGNGAARPDAGA